MDKTPEPDFLPQWDDSSPPPQTGSKGLIDQVLETGSLSRELVMPTGVYRVTTTIKLDAQQAMLFRSVVLHDELEMTAEPWQPILRNLTQELAGEPAKQARLTLARLALETHLRRCDAVIRQLEETGDLLPRRRISSQTYLLILVTLLAIVGAGSAVWFWPTKTQDETGTLAESAVTTPNEESTQPVQQESPEGSNATAEEAPLSEPETADVEAPPIQDSRPSQAEEPPAPKARSTPSTEATASQQKSKPKESIGSKPASPQVGSGESAKEEPVISQSPTASPPEINVAPPEPPQKSEPIVSPDQIFSSLVSSVVPRNHQIFIPQPGVSIYRDPNILLSEVPRSLHDTLCVTTGNPSGDSEQGMLLMLQKPAIVFVVHDTRVKKRPDWLDSFRATGEILKADEVDRGRSIEYTIYRKIFPEGSVSLGSNTKTKALTRIARRELGLKKNLFMYLACMTEWNPNP